VTADDAVPINRRLVQCTALESRGKGQAKQIMEQEETQDAKVSAS